MLKEGIGLRAYGQKDPLIEYKKERLISIGFPERFFETNTNYYYSYEPLS